ncbi:MAG: phospholipase D-like domain-containing protein [Xanthomonadales bacterium]|nr:phospholipase D-like domain-containing protein [Xanthomonadales bacterium]
MSHLIESMVSALGYSFVEGNRVQVLRNGDEIFPAMLNAINEAQNTIDMVTFVYWTGTIAAKFSEALSKAASRGVKTRLLLDAVGCRSMQQPLIANMTRAGVTIAWFRPIAQWKVWKWDNRTHRKLLLCDQQVAFTGGVGIAEEWEGNANNPSEWRDTHFQITGPVVMNMYSGFLTNWYEAVDVDDEEILLPRRQLATGNASIQVVRSPSSVNWSDIATVFRTLLSEARESIWITTAYFVPDDVLTGLLCSAVQRGVEVRLLVPGEHSDEAFSRLSGEDQFRLLLDEGVDIYLFAATMLHAKIMTVDHSLAVVGSANMNHRSMSKDEEFCLIIEDSETLELLEQQFEADMGRSDALDLANWKERSLWRRIGEVATRLLREEL